MKPSVENLKERKKALSHKKHWNNVSLYFERVRLLTPVFCGAGATDA